MKKLLAWVLVCTMFIIPSTALAIDSETVIATLALAEATNAVASPEIVEAIWKIVQADPLGMRRTMTVGQAEELAAAVSAASHATGTDWRLLLSISYVESNLCHQRWLKGDQKPGTTGKTLFDYWSVGCMQVNLRWWGTIVADAGLNQEDLLDYENGIVLGAMILKKYQDRYGWKEGIRRYNGTGHKATQYQAKVLKVYNTIA
jgi:hypothetical protein